MVLCCSGGHQQGEGSCQAGLHLGGYPGRQVSLFPSVCHACAITTLLVCSFPLRFLEKEYGIHCNLTLLFSFAQVGSQPARLSNHSYLLPPFTSPHLPPLTSLTSLPSPPSPPLTSLPSLPSLPSPHSIPGCGLCRGRSDSHLSVCGSDI